MMMKLLAVLVLVLAATFAFVPGAALAENTAVHGDVSGRSIVSGLLSLIVWPGIGQAVNENEDEKVITHAVLGLTGVFRLWSGWDALIDRSGGRWDGRI
jgi:hypothetical protein